MSPQNPALQALRLCTDTPVCTSITSARPRATHTLTPAVLASVKTRYRITSCSARRSCRIHSGVESTQRMLHLWNVHELLRALRAVHLTAWFPEDGRNSHKACRPLPTLFSVGSVLKANELIERPTGRKHREHEGGPSENQNQNFE